eukprot:2610956-Pyramimonas_sp.AAC.1
MSGFPTFRVREKSLSWGSGVSASSSRTLTVQVQADAKAAIKVGALVGVFASVNLWSLLPSGRFNLYGQISYSAYIRGRIEARYPYFSTTPSYLNGKTGCSARHHTRFALLAGLENARMDVNLAYGYRFGPWSHGKGQDQKTSAVTFPALNRQWTLYGRCLEVPKSPPP